MFDRRIEHYFFLADFDVKIQWIIASVIECKCKLSYTGHLVLTHILLFNCYITTLGMILFCRLIIFENVLTLHDLELVIMLFKTPYIRNTIGCG